MSNELIPKELTGGALTECSFDDLVSGGDSYLARLQLYGSKSDAVAENLIGMGRYGLVKDDIIVDLGPELDVIIICYRAKALQISGDNIITEHDPRSDIYQKIKELSKTKDSGCMHGPEFLVWIPSQEQFATYFASSKTARREAKKMEPLVGKAATLKCKLIETQRYKWHGPVIVPCSTPLDVPPIEDIQEQVEKFKNPPKSDIEIAADDNSDRER